MKCIQKYRTCKIWQKIFLEIELGYEHKKIDILVSNLTNFVILRCNLGGEASPSYLSTFLDLGLDSAIQQNFFWDIK